MRRLDTARRFSAAPLAGVCAFFTLALLAAPAAATTLIVLVSDRAIVIAADSLRTLAGGGTEAVCKIHDRDGVAYGFAGAVSAEGFDATAIAGRELAGSGDLAQKSRRIADALQAGLVEHFRTRRIEGTRRELLEGQRGRPVTGFVAALVDGRPQGFLILVLAEPATGGLTLSTRVEPLDTRGPDRAIFLELAASGGDRAGRRIDVRRGARHGARADRGRHDAGRTRPGARTGPARGAAQIGAASHGGRARSGGLPASRPGVCAVSPPRR